MRWYESAITLVRYLMAAGTSLARWADRRRKTERSADHWTLFEAIAQTSKNTKSNQGVSWFVGCCLWCAFFPKRSWGDSWFVKYLLDRLAVGPRGKSMSFFCRALFFLWLVMRFFQMRSAKHLCFFHVFLDAWRNTAPARKAEQPGRLRDHFWSPILRWRYLWKSFKTLGKINDLGGFAMRVLASFRNCCLMLARMLPNASLRTSKGFSACFLALGLARPSL